MDIRALARSFYDPGRFQSGYRDQKKQLRQNFQAEELAQNAAYGSIAQREDPNNFGSIASRSSNGLFSPEDPANLHDPAYDIAEQEAAQQAKLTARSKLRRKQPGMEDLQGLDGFDDLFGGLL